MATGTHKTARLNLQTMLSKCTHFQTWHGEVWDEAVALAHIYLGGLPRPANNNDSHTLAELNDFRPYAIVYTELEGGITFSQRAAGAPAGSPYFFIPQGLMWIEFERLVDTQDTEDNEAVEEEMVHEMDLIMSSDDTDDVTLTSQAGAAGVLNFTALTGFGPFRIPQNDVPRYGDVVKYSMSLDWGTQ